MKKGLSLVLVLAMVLGCFSFVSAASYSDVAGTSYEEAVARLSLLEILTGYNDGTFKPENQITRAEFAAVAVRAKGLEATAQASKGLPTGFSDVPATHWASGYVGTAAKMGIVNGVGNGQFAPAAPVKYEEAITMIVRALGYEPSAQAKGGYPYGYLIVANENGLLDDVKGTQGAPALRGEVAQIVDNALEIPMMIQVGFGTDTKWVVSGSKEHGDNAEERYLLDDMGFDSVKGRVITTNTKTKKITVDPTDEDLKNVTIKVAEGFDFYSVEGLEGKYWYKNDEVVVYVVKDEAKFDAVEYDADEKELTLITEDENYEVAKDAYLELNGSKVKAADFEADYAKIAFNDDDEIIWAQGYTLDGFVLVEEVKDNVAYGYDEYDEIKIKDFLVVEDGKTIGVDGIEEEDILFYNTDEDFAVVANKGTEGELERVYTTGSTAFRFEGAGYAYSDLGAVYFDEGKVGDLDSAILGDFLDDEEKVTVYVDFAGDAVVVAGPVSSVGNSAYAVLLNDPQDYTGRKGDMVALDVRNGANEKASYDLPVKDLNGKDIKLTNIKVEEVSEKNELQDLKGNKIEEGTVLKISVDKDGDVTAIELPESVELSKAFDIDDANAKGTDGYSYKLQASTIVFYDSNKKAVTLGNAKDAFKEVKSGATVYYEKGRVVAVVADTDADADTKNVTGLVKEVSTTSNGKLQFRVLVFGSTQRLLTESKILDEDDFADYKNSIRTFKVGETSGEIKGFADTKQDVIKIDSKSGKTITGKKVDSGEKITVELNRNAKLYDEDKKTEIGTSDLKVDDVITVYYQGSSKTFVDYVIKGSIEKPGTVEPTPEPVTYTGVKASGKVTVEGVTAVSEAKEEKTAEKTITDIKFVSKLAGAEGNSIAIEIKEQAGASKDIVIVVTGKTIKVGLATDALEDIASTKADVVAAVNGDAKANALVTASVEDENKDDLAVVAAKVSLEGGQDKVEKVEGKEEVYTLTITSGATKAGGVITVKGGTADVDVDVTKGDSAEDVASAIQGSALAAAGYNITRDGNKVIFTATAKEAKETSLNITVVDKSINIE